MRQSPTENYAVTLSTGRTIQLADVQLETGNQHFYYGAADVTDQLDRDLKFYFPGFDIEADNIRLSNEAQLDRGHSIGADGSTDIFELWFENIGSDIAGGSQAIRNFITGSDDGPDGTGAPKLFTLKNVLIFTAVGVGLYYTTQTIKSFRK